MVALRKESVDRNAISAVLELIPLTVALRKESVDRNRRRRPRHSGHRRVALRKESVDRNNRPHSQKYINSRRSPQGERG